MSCGGDKTIELGKYYTILEIDDFDICILVSNVYSLFFKYKNNFYYIWNSPQEMRKLKLKQINNVKSRTFR